MQQLVSQLDRYFLLAYARAELKLLRDKMAPRQPVPDFVRHNGRNMTETARKGTDDYIEKTGLISR
jgi:hypothetical protein